MAPFPGDVKIEDWFSGDDIAETPGYKWLFPHFVSTGGAGVGVGLLLTIALTIALFCYCCCRQCCRCCFRRSGTKDTKTRLSRSKWLLLTYILLAAACLTCAVAMNQAGEKAVTALDRAFDGSIAFTEEAQHFLCSSDGSAQAALEQQTRGLGSDQAALLEAQGVHCRNDSVLGLVSGADRRVRDLTADAKGVITSASGSVSADLIAAEASSANVSAAVEGMRAQLSTIAAHAASILETAAQLPPTPSPFVFDVPDVAANLADVVASLTQIADATSQIGAARTAVDGSLGGLEVEVSADLEAAQLAITQALAGVGEAAQDALLDGLAPAQADAQRMRTETVTERDRRLFVLGVTLVPLLGLVAVLAGGCGAAAGGRRGGQCGAFIVFVCLFWVCTFMGACGFGSLAATDACEHRPELLATNLAATTFTVDGVVVRAADTADELLHCGVTVPGQYPSVLPLSSPLSTDGTTPQTFADILGLRTVFNRTRDLAPAFASLDTAVAQAQASAQALDIGTTSLEAAIDEFDRPVPGGGGEYSTATTLDGQLDAADAECATLPASPAAAAAVRDQCVASIASMWADAAAMQAALDALAGARASASSSAAALVASLRSAAAPIGALDADIASLRVSAEGIAAYVAGVPAQTGCAFVGAAYAAVVDTAACAELASADGGLWGAYLAGAGAAGAMFTAFMLVLLPWRPVEVEQCSYEYEAEAGQATNGGGLPIYCDAKPGAGSGSSQKQWALSP